eukprot:TRINITY_DN3020_c1_g1_i1.p1 TRINITY_DN3020_c1_g1~~TRINITY_DN3020_c1_g1_i1.p1  ORF type:complete len:620 (-),score=147.63 TRINITY_DN3020_c1_g1_i1:137-1996(-)
MGVQKPGKAAGAPADALRAARQAEARIGQEEARRKFTRIDSFEGIYSFLDLDSLCDVAWKGDIYRSARHALLAAQYPDATDAILGPNAKTVADAKKIVTGESEDKEWSSFRLQAMEKILRDKFRRSDDFRKKLKETGDRDIAWENSEDTFWGTTKGRGQNHMGRLVQEVRSCLEDDTEFETWLFVCCDLEKEEVRRPPVELVEIKNSEDGSKETKGVHRLNGKEYFKMGKLPSNALVALHPSVSREHAVLIHTKADVARKSGGVAVMDMGSKAGTFINGERILHAYTMEPLKGGDVLKLGASTRDYEVKVNMRAQIEALEQQQRDLMREVQAIDQDAADPVQAAKRQAKEEATVFVGGLDTETEKAELLTLFMDCGKVEEVRFPGQQEAGGKAVKGIAFVVFSTPMAARRACGLNKESFKGKRIRVASATEGGKGKGKGKGKDGKEGGGGGQSDSSSRAFLRDVLDGKWARGEALPSRSPERPPRDRGESRFDRGGGDRDRDRGGGRGDRFDRDDRGDRGDRGDRRRERSRSRSDAGEKRRRLREEVDRARGNSRDRGRGGRDRDDSPPPAKKAKKNARSESPPPKKSKKDDKKKSKTKKKKKKSSSSSSGSGDDSSSS